MGELLEILKLHNQSDVITFVFGITSGLLTLVGLISIFISINTQHTAEKAREVYWDLVTLPHSYSNFKDPKIFKEVYNKFWLYDAIINSPKGITYKVIKITKLSISVVITVWLILLCLLIPTFYLNEFLFISISTLVIILLLMVFKSLLNKLSNIKEFAKLPSTSEILDANNDEIRTSVMSLAGMSSRLQIHNKGRNEYRILIGFPVPFINLTISSVITSRGVQSDNEEFTAIIKWDEDDTIVTSNDKFHFWNDCQTYWIEITKFSIPEKVQRINVQLNLCCIKGLSHVHFNNIPVQELIESQSPISYSSLPDDYNEFYLTKREDVWDSVTSCNIA